MSDNQSQIEAMFTAGVHAGYSRSRRHPSTTPHVHAVKNRVDIIDLDHTLEQLSTAKEFLKGVKNAGKKVLFIGTKAEIKRIVSDAANNTNMPSVTKRWVGGTLTNFKEIRGRIDILEDLEQRKATNSLVYRTKKELLMIERKIDKLELNFGGLKDLREMPAAIIVVDSLKEDIAIKEARVKGIPVVAIANTDCDISIIDYPIVANDATQGSVNYIMNELVEVLKN